MDIGGTLIGMHLRRVAVPVRLSMDHIGQAILLCARTRPPFIGVPAPFTVRRKCDDSRSPEAADGRGRREDP